MNIKTLFVTLMFSTLAFADLGDTSNPIENQAKTALSNIGVTQIYDHPGAVVNGQYVIPVQYNGNQGTEHDPNDAKPNDIDYIPVSQLKGTTGQAGAVGSTGSQGSIGQTGANGTNGTNGSDASIDGHTFINVGASIRWYDWKNVNLTSGYRYDFNHHEHTVDAMIINIKLGKSFEDRKVSELQDRVDRLERMLSR